MTVGKASSTGPVERLFLLSLILVATAIWTVRLTSSSFWIDEQIAAEIAASDGADDVWRQVLQRERRPPGYHLLLYATRLALGDSDYGLRFPSLASGILAMCVTARLTRELSGRRAMQVAVALIVTSPFLALYVPMVRYYSLVWLLTASAWLLLRRWAHGSVPAAYGYAACMATLCYTDPAIIPVATGHALYIWARHRHITRRWGLLIAGIALLFVPWLRNVLIQSQRDLIRSDLSQGAVGMALRLAAPLYVWTVGEATFPWEPAAWLGLLAGLALSLAMLHRRDVLKGAGLSVVIPLGFTAILVGAIAPDITFLNVASRSLYAAPALYACWGTLIGSRPTLGRRLALAAILTSNVIGMAHALSATHLLNPIYAVPAREIALTVAKEAEPGDLFLAPADSVVERYWPDNAAVPLLESRSAEARTAAAQVEGRVWLLTLGRDRTRARAALDVIKTLEARCRVVRQEGYAPIDPTYQRVREIALRHPSYSFKATLTLYECPGGADADRP